MINLIFKEISNITFESINRFKSKFYKLNKSLERFFYRWCSIKNVLTALLIFFIIVCTIREIEWVNTIFNKIFNHVEEYLVHKNPDLNFKVFYWILKIVFMYYFVWFFHIIIFSICELIIFITFSDDYDLEQYKEEILQSAIQIWKNIFAAFFIFIMFNYYDYFIVSNFCDLTDFLEAYLYFYGWFSAFNSCIIKIAITLIIMFIFCNYIIEIFVGVIFVILYCLFNLKYKRDDFMRRGR